MKGDGIPVDLLRRHATGMIIRRHVYVPITKSISSGERNTLSSYGFLDKTHLGEAKHDVKFIRRQLGTRHYIENIMYAPAKKRRSRAVKEKKSNAIPSLVP